jgi:hypothetical protein
MAHNQWRYPEWPSGQPCGSPKTRLKSLWPASALREQNVTTSSQLDHRYAEEVENIITSVPQQDTYTKL